MEDSDRRDAPSEPVGQAVLLVSCVLCRRFHRAEDVFDFNPVCVTCAAGRATLRLLEMGGPDPLGRNDPVHEPERTL